MEQIRGYFSYTQNARKSKETIKRPKSPIIKISSTPKEARAVKDSRGNTELLTALQEENKYLKLKTKELEESLTKLKQYQNKILQVDEYTTAINILDQKFMNLMVKVTTIKSNDKDLKEKFQLVKIHEYQTKINKEITGKLVKIARSVTGQLSPWVNDINNKLRILHNNIEDMKGNIRVFCRVRPRISKESAKRLCTLNFPDECTIEIGRMATSEVSNCRGRVQPSSSKFLFNKVFLPSATQAEIFEELALLVQSASEGYNVCIFAHGTTNNT